MAVQPVPPLTTLSDGRGLTAAWLGLAMAVYVCTLMSGSVSGPAFFAAAMLFSAVCVVPAAGRDESRLTTVRMMPAAGLMAVMLLPFYAGLAARSPLAWSAAIGLVVMGWAACIFWTFIMRSSRMFYRIALLVAVFLPLLAGLLTLRSPAGPVLLRVSPLGAAWHIAVTGRWINCGWLLALHGAVLAGALVCRQRRKGCV